MRKFRAWLRNTPTAMWILVLGTFVNIVFFSFLWPLNAIYLHSVLHKSMGVTGIVLFVYSLAGFFGNFIGGWLYDRFGAIKVLSVNAGVCVPVVASLAAFHQFSVYVLLITAFGMLSLVPFPVLNALIVRAWTTGQRRGFNYNYVTFNVGTAVGTAAGGVLAEWSFQAIYILLACGYTIFFFMVLLLYRRYFSTFSSVVSEDKLQANSPQSTTQRPIRWSPIFIILIGYGIAWAIYVQWMTIIPIYMQLIHIRASDYSLLWTINGIVVVLFQPLISWIIRHAPSLTLQLVAGIPLYGFSFLCITFSHSYLMFVLGILLLSIGEMFVWPAVPSVLSTLVPPGKHGVVQGAVGSVAALGRMVGPLIGGMLYDTVPISKVLILFALSAMIPFTLFSINHRRQFHTSVETSA